MGSQRQHKQRRSNMAHHISARLTVLRRGLLHLLLLAAMLNPAAVSPRAATQRVEIGQFTSAGRIALQLEKFHEQFADGTRIAEITLADDNGYSVVRRKGYSASGELPRREPPVHDWVTAKPCRANFVAPAGTPVFVPTLLRVMRTACWTISAASLPVWTAWAATRPSGRGAIKRL